MTVYVQAPLPSRRSGTKDWAELGVTQQDDLLRAAILDTEKMYELADQLGLKDGPTDFLFTSLHQLEPPPEDDQRRLAMEGFALRRTTGTNLGLRLERALRRRDGGVPDGPEPPLTGAAEPSSPSDPNSRTFDEVRVGLERGELRMFVDHSRALQAVVEGFPISRAGLIAKRAIPLSMVAGMAMAVVWTWWWFPVGILVAAVAFFKLRSEAMMAIRHRALHGEQLFNVLRRNGTIWIGSRQD